MKKLAHQTARVHWHMGQALLPEHFYAQESSAKQIELYGREVIPRVRELLAATPEPDATLAGGRS